MSGSLVNWDAALAGAGGDEDILRSVVGAFLEETPGLVSLAHKALQQNDPSTLRRASHTLKGSLRFFGAQLAADAAWQLEQLTAQEDWSAAGSLLAELENRLLSVTAELQQRCAAH